MTKAKSKADHRTITGPHVKPAGRKPRQMDLVEYLGGDPRGELNAHLWDKDDGEHYVEEHWCNTRLFQEEHFCGEIYDPCSGFGRIPQAAKAAGFRVTSSDLVDRRIKADVNNRFAADALPVPFRIQNFLTTKATVDNVVMNPPFSAGRLFVEHALKLTTNKVAAIVPVRRLNAMGKWTRHTPLFRIWMMTPRPSMPPGSYITAGGKVGGGTVDFCWCIWLQGYDGGKPTIEWLHRDRDNQ